MQQYLQMRHHGKLARIRMVSDGAFEYAKKHEGDTHAPNQSAVQSAICIGSRP